MIFPRIVDGVRTALALEVVAKREPERLVFGYAVLASKRDGTPLIDLQGHHVELGNLETAVYRYVEQDEEHAALCKVAAETAGAVAALAYDGADVLKRATVALLEVLGEHIGKAVGGEMHEGAARSTLVESMVLTPEKMTALGIPAGTVPAGWWVGYRVPIETYKRVELGSRIMFSIEGRGLLSNLPGLMVAA